MELGRSWFSNMEAPPPTCTISFNGAQRAWADGSNLLGIKVLVDGSVVSTVTPSDGNTFVSETTASFTVSQGSHTITLEGYDPENIDTGCSSNGRNCEQSAYKWQWLCVET